MIADRNRLARTEAHAVALDCLESGIRAARPRRVLGDKLALEDTTLFVDGTPYDLAVYDRVVLLGGGKAAGTVAVALESLLGGWLDDGVVVADTPADTDTVDVVVGDHPIPSDRGLEGTARVREAAASADDGTLVLAAVSGGGSALLPAPAADISLADLRSVTDPLLESGASIDEINAVRKHCSTIKGGGLAVAARPATVVGILFSDVTGDNPGVVASGPLSPDETTYDDAIEVLDRYSIDAPVPVRERLERGAAGDVGETPGSDEPAFDSVSVHVLANARTALEAAADAAAHRGYEPHVLSSRIRGEAREAALTQVAIAKEMRATGDPFAPPAVVLSGGETTVTVRGDGTGGPNQEFALAAALAIESGGVVLAAADTDGRDGTGLAAGAIVDASTVDDTGPARAALERNDAGGYLREQGTLIQTGATGTNVNDLRAVVVDTD